MKQQRPDGRPNLRLVPDLEPEPASSAVESSFDGSDDALSDPRLPLRLEIDVDEEYFSYATSGEIDFPDDFEGPIQVILTKAESLVGRRSDQRSIEPEIDLAELTADPAVSIEHAKLQVGPGSSISITDLGSTNGTVVGVPGGADIDSDTKVPFPKGSSVYLGAWTKLTVVGVGLTARS